MFVAGGATNVTTYVAMRLTADGKAATGLTITNFDLQYTRSGVAPTAKVDATALAATDSAHADNKAIEIDATDQPGLYRVDWPDAAFAAAVREVILSIKCATAFTEHIRVEIDAEVNVVEWGGTDVVAGSIPTAVAGAAGGVFIAGSNAATSVTTALTANITGNLSGSVGSVTTKTGYALVSTGADLILKSSTFALAIADAVWDELMAGHTTADTSGLVLNEWQDGGRLDVILDARMAEASIDTTGGAVDTVTTITTKTGFALSSTGADLILKSSTFALAIADAVWDEVQSGHTTAGTFGLYLDSVVSGVSDPWGTALPGSYAAGTGGYLVGTYLDSKISDVGGAIGSGAIAHTITVTSSGSPVDNVSVWITSDAAGATVVAGVLRTNSAGKVTFNLDAGTWYSWFEHAGYNFTNPQTETVA